MTDALAAGSQASQFFDREAPAPEPSLIDHIMDTVGYAGETANIAADRFGGGMANLAGLPVDATNLITELGMRGADAVIPGDQS